MVVTTRDDEDVDTSRMSTFRKIADKPSATSFAVAWPLLASHSNRSISKASRVAWSSPLV
jgi:hypothetical protein